MPDREKRSQSRFEKNQAGNFFPLPKRDCKGIPGFGVDFERPENTLKIIRYIPIELLYKENRQGEGMEVKSIFVNLIMKNYEKHGAARPVQSHADPVDAEPSSDTVSISSQASKRLFGELMEHSLKKGLSGVVSDEG
jgi:hypothetical protein